jgi:hypothetical protein
VRAERPARPRSTVGRPGKHRKSSPRWTARFDSHFRLVRHLNTYNLYARDGTGNLYARDGTGPLARQPGTAG